MKITFFLTFMAYLGLALAVIDWEGRCAHKAPSVVNAIGKFCQKGNGVVPSHWGDNGANGYTANTLVRIMGHCSPPQWIPSKYCFSQFYRMCANSEFHTGTSVKNFGRNGCQQWAILNGGL